MSHSLVYLYTLPVQIPSVILPSLPVDMFTLNMSHSLVYLYTLPVQIPSVILPSLPVDMFTLYVTLTGLLVYSTCTITFSHTP